MRNNFHRQGSTLAFVMILIAVLSTIAAGLLFSASARYHTTYQSASWQESLVAAEAGVDLAMNELRKRVINGSGGAFDTASNWTAKDGSGNTYLDNGHAFPANNQPYLITTHSGEGNTTMSVRVFADVPGSSANPWPLNSLAQKPPSTVDPFINEQNDSQGIDPNGRWWYRIRALGIAGVSGPPRVNLDTRDNRLRKFSFFTDWRTGAAVNTPQVSRLVEIVAKPLTNFRNAIMAEKGINLANRNVLIDSYNSTKGPYDPLKNTGFMGNIATNGRLINASNATVMGDAMTNDGSVKDATGVTGQQRADFYQELLPVQPLTSWDTVPNQFVITSDASFTASADSSNPTRIHLNGINLAAATKSNPARTISILPAVKKDGKPIDGPSYIKIYVEGDIVTNGNSAIVVADGVNAIFYFTGNISLNGDGLVNNSLLPGRVLLNGIQPPANADGSLPSRSIVIATNQDFAGLIYAPNHDIGLKMTATSDYKDNGSGNNGNHYGQNNGGGDSGFDDGGLGNFLDGFAPFTGAPTHLPTALNGAFLGAQTTDHNAGYNGIFGGFVGRSITLTSATHLHYDEALREAGPVNHYEITNWFEDTSSRETVNW